MERAFVCTPVKCRRETGVQVDCARTMSIRDTRHEIWGGGTVSVQVCSDGVPVALSMDLGVLSSRLAAAVALCE